MEKQDFMVKNIAKREKVSRKMREREGEGEREGKSGKNLLPIQVGCPIGTTFAHKVPLFNPSLRSSSAC